MSERKKILIITPSSKFGGAERNIALIAEHIPREKYSLHLATTFGTGDLTRRFIELGFEAEEFDYGSNPLRIFDLFSYASRIQPDLIHSFLLRGNWIAAAIKAMPWAKRIPWAASERGLDITRPNWKAALNRTFLGNADVVLAVSEPVKRILVERDGIAEERIKVLQGGVPDALPPLSLPDAWPALERPSMVVVSHLRREKNVELAIASFAETAKKGVKGSLFLFGDGPERERLVSLASELGVSPYIHFAGNVLDARRMLGHFDLLALPSKEEGFPNVMLEAWQAGLPVLSTDTPGAREISGPDDAALLASAEDFPAAMASLLSSPERRAELATRGKIRVKDFSIQNVITTLDGYYEELLSGKTQSRS